ncbi:MAG: phosphomannomutase/phosphoglucomutase [Planctomycetota bacterium]
MISKVFKAYDVRALYPDPLDEKVGFKVGYATAAYLKKEVGDGPIAVSRDMRPSAPSMAQALINGLTAAGADVIDLGMCDTSQQYFAIPHLGAIGGVQVTASHNPIDYIGFKISREDAKPVGRDTGLLDIQAIAEGLNGSEEAGSPGSVEQRDLWDAYRAHILGFMGELARPLKLYVDASNGMGTSLLEKVFAGVPNLEITAINNVYSDKWAHEPNPLVPENVLPTIEGVKATGADLGACFDGDADRCMLVDDAGVICGCDHLTAWLADHFVSQSHADASSKKPTTIVYDLRSSKVVEESVKALGAEPRMSKVGHVNMKAVLRESGGVFGGELSGHFYFRDNSYADSGAITLAAAMQVLAKGGAKLSEQIGGFRKYPQSGELNFQTPDKQAAIDGVKQKYGADADAVLELDGVSVDCFESQGWWANIRASNTEPLLRLNMEAKDQATLDKMLGEIAPTLGTPDAGH